MPMTCRSKTTSENPYHHHQQETTTTPSAPLRTGDVVTDLPFHRYGLGVQAVVLGRLGVVGFVKTLHQSLLDT